MENIIGDRNCLFRYLSKIITGNQESHFQLRSIISHLIASEGTTKLAWYLRPKCVTPSDYFLGENCVHIEGMWGSDVEIKPILSMI